MAGLRVTKSSLPHVTTHGAGLPKNILLGQLTSNGDCLFATTVARQIKTDYPECHLTWAIGSMCRSIIDGNPYVDEVWEIPLTRNEDVAAVWTRFESEARERKRRGDFDEIFLTQIAPANLQNYDGTIRSSIFHAYPNPITVPVTPVIRLSQVEVENVRRFAEYHRLASRTHVVLFECSPKSGQSFVTPEFALEIALKLTNKIPDVCVILSSNVPIHATDERIIDGSLLSLRENAELTKYSTLLVGCSSGISWLCTSEWAKPLSTIQLINPRAIWFASLVHDYKYWGFPTENIIEMSNYSVDKLFQCIMKVFADGFSAARLTFHQEIKILFSGCKIFFCDFILHGQFLNAGHMIKMITKRHGLHPQIILWFPLELFNRLQTLLKTMFRHIFKCEDTI